MEGAILNLFAKRRDEIARSADWSRPRISLVVQVGNGQEAMNFDRELALNAKIGDRIDIFPEPGQVEKIASDGWVQWKLVVEESGPCLS